MTVERPPPVILTKRTRERWELLHWRLRHGLPVWTIYRPPTREYGPISWVARCWITLPKPRPTRWVMTHDSLEELRTLLPRGLHRLPREAEDTPEIVETWI